MKYKIWEHYDTGVCVIIDAKNEEEAYTKADEAIEKMTKKEFKSQIYNNLEGGDIDIIDRKDI